MKEQASLNPISEGNCPEDFVSEQIEGKEWN